MKDNHLTQKKQQSKSPKHKKHELLTKKDIEELMGVNMSTYTRGKGGAIRRK